MILWKTASFWKGICTPHCGSLGVPNDYCVPYRGIHIGVPYTDHQISIKIPTQSHRGQCPGPGSVGPPVKPPATGPSASLALPLAVSTKSPVLAPAAGLGLVKKGGGNPKKKGSPQISGPISNIPSHIATQTKTRTIPDPLWSRFVPPQPPRKPALQTSCGCALSNNKIKCINTR